MTAFANLWRADWLRQLTGAVASGVIHSRRLPKSITRLNRLRRSSANDAIHVVRGEEPRKDVELARTFSNS